MHNPTFLNDNNDVTQKTDTNHNSSQQFSKVSPLDNEQMVSTIESNEINNAEPTQHRENWGKGVEFLMSCIAMSVGLGNVWRFPFTALENGGGAFLLPYVIVLILIGRPIYYLEMIVGQFSSKSSIKVFDLAPIFRGVGVGQLVAISLLSTYYAAIMSLIGRYLWDSFKSPLPWSQCKANWINCIDSNGTISNSTGGNQQLTSSSEYYFDKEVLQEVDNIDNGIGYPILDLAIFLLIAWIFIAGVLINGIRSSGKASYFLALFPYVILGILLIRAVTLKGAWNGIWYFINPRWEALLSPNVWFAAITQVFFSLAVCFGNIVMYSSYNKFNHNVYRDVKIVTTLDTFTSLIAGCTIFGILGHLANEIGTDDIASVIKGGPGLAFISYPEAIARFKFMPQLFSILFFFMLFVLGIGSNIAMVSCAITTLRDQFPSVKAWQAAVGISICNFSIGLVYVTPGGQHLLNLVDFYGASFIVYILAIAELIAICWVYGVSRVRKDIKFMLNLETGYYWRICWTYVSPTILIFVLAYSLISYKALTYKGHEYPTWAVSLGWSISVFGIIQLPIWAIYEIRRQRKTNICDKISSAFKSKPNWGPANPTIKEQYDKERNINSFNGNHRV